MSTFLFTQFVSSRIDFSFSHTCQVYQCFNFFLHFMCALSYKEYIICVCIRVCLSVCLYVCFAITIDIICLCVALAITSGDSSLPLVKVRRGTNFQTKGKRGWCSKAGFLVSLEFQLFLSVSVWLRCRSLLKGTKLPSSQCTTPSGPSRIGQCLGYK